MDHAKNMILAAVAAIGSIVTNALGGWDVSLQVLIGMMAADYLTGWLVAAVWKKSNKSATGALDSRAGWKGLCRKGVIFLLVWVGSMLDTALGVAYVRAAVCWFFIGNEGLSLLENIGLMGVPFPKFLRNALEALRDKADEGGEGHDGGQ